MGEHIDTFLMVLATMLAAIIAFFQYRITSLQNAAQVSIYYDTVARAFILKNYGNLKANDIRLLTQHIEIENDTTGKIHDKIYRTRNGPIFAQEEVQFTPATLSPSYKSDQPQFLICVWKFKKTLFDESCHRIFLKMPQSESWMTANQTLIHHKQWEMIENALVDLNRRFDDLAETVISKFEAN